MDTLTLTEAKPAGSPASQLLLRRSRLESCWFLAPLLLFLGLASFVTSRHEMWSDELQHWGIAVSSDTPWDVIKNLRYESSPALWHLCLYVLKQFTHNPVAMQVFHVALATSAMAVFLIWAPFTRLQKLLFVFGFWPLYEYSAISRHYVLTELLFFLFLALYPWSDRRAIWAGVALFLQAQTSVFGFIVSFACGLAMVVKEWRGGDLRALAPQTRISLAIVLLGLVVSFIQLRQPADSAIHSYWDFINEQQALRTSTLPWRALFPIAALRFDFWNSNILDTFLELHSTMEIAPLLLQGLLSTILGLLTLYFLRRNRVALTLFLTITLGCLAFFYTKKLGFGRHHGHLYMAWIGALWLLWRMGQVKGSPQSTPRPGATHGCVTIALTTVLAVNVLAAAYVCTMDVRFRFSAARDAAEWIRSHQLIDCNIIAEPSIAAFLDEDVYLVPNARRGRFILFRKPLLSMDMKSLARLCDKLTKENGRRCLLVSQGGSWKELKRSASNLVGFRIVVHWLDSLCPYENYIVYEPIPPQ